MLLADEGGWELSLKGHIGVAHLLLMLGEAGEAAHERKLPGGGVKRKALRGVAPSLCML